MRMLPHAAVRFVAAVTIMAGLVPMAGRAAQTSARDPHAHPNGPHQTLPPLRTIPPPPATMALHPPPLPVLPPPLAVPTRPVEPPPPPAVSDNAIGSATPIPDGLRVTFGSGESAISPATDSALQGLARGVPAGGAVNVVAYAAGTPDDPSTARRESLSRALEVRSVLIHAGLASPRIYVRALGASVSAPAGVSPDRVDVTVTAAAAPQAAPAPAPPAAGTPAEKAAP